MHGAWQISIGTLLPFPKKIMFLDSVPRWSRLVNFSPLQSTIIGKKIVIFIAHMIWTIQSTLIPQWKKSCIGLQSFFLIRTQQPQQKKYIFVSDSAFFTDLNYGQWIYWKAFINIANWFVLYGLCIVPIEISIYYVWNLLCTYVL